MTNSRSRSRILAVCVAWLALVVVTVCGCRKAAPGGEAEGEKKGPDEVVVETAVAATRAMDDIVEAQGTLAPGQGAIARLASPVAGRLIAVNVREGDRVMAGQVLAVVDNRTQQAVARSAAAAMTSAEALALEADLAARGSATDQSNSVRLAELVLATAKLDFDNAVTQAQTALQSAQTDLQKVRAGARPQEIAEADLAVRQAQATRDRAATEIERVRFLLDRGIDSKRQLDDAQTALAVADSALEWARQQASLVKSGSRPEDVRTAELKVRQAREALAQAKSTGEAKVAQAEAALMQAKQSAFQVAVKQQDARAQHRTVEQKRAEWNAAQAAASTAEIRAPFTGVVTRRSLNAGDVADTTNPVVEISQPAALNLAAFLPVADGQKVRVGMSVRISTSDVPGQAFGGRVLSVGQVDPQTNLLTVRIAVANPGGALKAGTFAAADIIVRTIPRAVVLPKQAVVTKETGPTVFVVTPDGKAQGRTVSLGSEQNGLVEIVKGLRAGEKVIKLGQYELADGTKVKEAGEGAEGGAKGETDKP